MASRQRGFVSSCWELLRKFYILIFGDPKSKIIINGKIINLPLSHQLPIYLNRHPEYDKLIGRLSVFLRNESRPLIFIDVGANVGDTIAQFDPKQNDLVIAIEPNEKFGMYLEMNYGKKENIKIIKSACSSSIDLINLAFDEKKGTASLIRADKSASMSTVTIDLITNQFHNIKNVAIIKIDTDGFDFEVIKGAKSTIKNNSPAILFECDVFKNQNYIDDITITLDLLYSCGYTEFLVYDNYGFLVGKYLISEKFGNG